MNAAPTPFARRGAVAAIAVAMGLLVAMPAGGTAHASPPVTGHGGRGPCPAAESLVPGTTWHKHTLAPGVVMTAGTATDSRGTVNMHVLRVNLDSKNVSLRTLRRSLAERSPLSSIAQGRAHLVAATNTGYFDFRTGAPTDPLITASYPYVISTAHKAVVGVAKNGLLESGKVWWSATMTAGKRTRVLAGRNEIYPLNGITEYTASWGPTPVPTGFNGAALAVVKGVVASLPRGQFQHGINVPSGGVLLVAHGEKATNWLSAVPIGTKVSIAGSVKTNAAKPFVQAYGVGVEVVASKGVKRSGFSCNSANTEQPARTEIGIARGGHVLVVAIVADNPNTTMHGLDEDQMSELMVQLGVDQAFAFDGSGSTELLAKLAGSSRLVMQNYPADGQERPMPVGLGVFSVPVKAKKKAKH